MKFILFLILILVLTSCNGTDKKKPVYYAVPLQEEITDGEEVIIPFRKEGGVKYVPVKINGLSCEMIFDTGCSSALISLAEAATLYQNGELLEEDFIGTSRSQIADGSVVENMVVRLRKVVLDDKVVCQDVIATVSNNIHAPLLLGNEILNRLATITIDNENNYLIFKLKQP